MSDTPISALPTAVALTGAEIVPVVQSGTTVQTTVTAIAAKATPLLPGGATFATQYNNAGAFAGVGPGTVGQSLVSNGTGVAPSYQTLSPNGSTPSHDALITQVSTLLHMDGTNGSTAFIDSGPNSLVFTAGGGAQLSTTNPKFGTACGTFDGSTAFLTSPITAVGPLDILNGDFTIEGWFNPTNVGGQHILFDLSNISNGGFRVYILSNTVVLQGFGFGGIGVTNAAAITVNNWHHIAVVRYGPSYGLFLDGIPVWVILSNLQPGPLASTLYIGASSNSSGQNTWYVGLIDEFRITKGVARYINQFAVPTSAFPNQ